MTIRRLTAIIRDERKDDAVSEGRITEYVNALEARLCEDVFLTHEGTPPGVYIFLGRPPERRRKHDWPPFVPHEPGYSNEWTPEDYRDMPLLVAPPYDDIYRAYIQWQIDLRHNDTYDAGNSQRLYWQAYQDFAKWWNRTHMPKQKVHFHGYYKEG